MSSSQLRFTQVSDSLTEEYTAIDKKKAKKASKKSKDDDSSVSSAEDKPKRKPGRLGSGKKAAEEKPKESAEEAVENELFTDIIETPKPLPKENNQGCRDQASGKGGRGTDE